MIINKILKKVKTFLKGLHEQRSADTLQTHSALYAEQSQFSSDESPDRRFCA